MHNALALNTNIVAHRAANPSSSRISFRCGRGCSLTRSRVIGSLLTLCGRGTTWSRRLGHEFLEARIIPKRIEHWIEPEQRGSERDAHRKKTTAWYREQFLNCRDSAVGLSCLC